MEWTEPKYSKNAVNKAVKLILKSASDALNDDEFDDWESAQEIVNNWRASHAFPLNTFQNSLRSNAKKVCNDFIIAQRIERMPSIVHKLDRFSSMKVSQIQDIGGCRAILPDIEAVNNIRNIFITKSRMKHELHHEDNYILNPKESGYRGIHLVYKYKSDRKETYNSLLIEIQIRTVLQHAWATAVETVGLFVGQALKSSLGPQEWLNFFRIISSGIAMIEKTPLIPGTSIDKKELATQIKKYSKSLDVFNRLDGYSKTMKIINDSISKHDHFFIIQLDTINQQSKIITFKQSQSEQASKEYAKLEDINKENKAVDVVLVSVSSLDQLRKAYPNYFADTKIFMDVIKSIIR